MMAMQYPSRERIRALFDIDSEKGAMTWRERPREDFPDTRAWTIWNTRYAGARAGWRNKSDGYWYVAIDNKNYSIHRLVYIALSITEICDLEIDHIDGDRENNAIWNLRLATSAENKRNAGLKHNNTSGFNGVSWDKARGKFRSYSRDASGRKRHIGYFDNVVEAAKSRDAFVRREHGEFARTNFKETE